MLLIAALLIGYGARGVLYASGLAGTQGSISVFLCGEVYGGPRGGTRTVCNGTFRSDDGRTTDSNAAFDDGFHHKMGDTVPVTWAGGETYFTARPANVFGWATMLLAGIWALASAVPAVWAGQYARFTPDPSRPVRASRLTARTAWWGAATCGAAALFSLLIQIA